MKRAVRRVVNALGIDIVRHRSAPPDFSPADAALFRSVAPYTMTSPERVFAAASAACYVAAANVPGAIVECGVWRGGSTQAAARTLIASGDTGRDLYLFDTFEGMPAPTAEDEDVFGRPAKPVFDRTRTGADRSAWCVADVEDVAANLARTGYDMNRVHLVKGKVEETLPDAAPERIALLRLDTDWYQSTKHELETLYPRLAPRGVLIVDDYGHWRGSRRAVDEYLRGNPDPVLLNRIDYTARMAVKV